MQKIVNNLPVDKNILSIFKTVYGGDKLKNLMMQNDVVTYENVKKTIQEIKTEKDFQNIIKERIEKEKKIDEIVSSL